MPRMLLLGAGLGFLVVAIPAGAQPANNSNNAFAGAGLLPKKPAAPVAPDVRGGSLSWPRLDPGAVLCRTEADLERLGARRSGESVDGPIDCQIIRAATAVSIVQRKGPGRAEVMTADPRSDAVTGWTDAWLPDKGSAGKVSVSK